MPTKKQNHTVRKVRKTENLPEDGRLLNFHQAANFLGLGYSTLRRLVKSGTLKAVNIGGNFKPRISLSALRAFIAGKEVA